MPEMPFTQSYQDNFRNVDISNIEFIITEITNPINIAKDLADVFLISSIELCGS